MESYAVYAFAHQFHLAPVGVSVLFPPLYADTSAIAVTGVDPASILVRTGVSSGPLDVTFGHGPPTAEQLRLIEEWDKTWLTAPIERPIVLFPSADELAFEVFEPDIPGPHHVLVAGIGRDTHWDLVVAKPVEKYLILVWPTGPQ